jgi:hypothetical protein
MEGISPGGGGTEVFVDKEGSRAGKTDFRGSPVKPVVVAALYAF